MTNSFSPKKNFYEWVNHEWLNDPKNAIPPDQTSWGGFVKLREESVQNQIEIAKDISQKINDLSEAENTIKCVWLAALKQYYNWSDYSPIREQFSYLQNFDIGSHKTNLARYMYHCSLNSISNVFTFDDTQNPISSR